MNKDKKSLSETHPDLAKEAHGWDPKTVTRGFEAKIMGNDEVTAKLYAEQRMISDNPGIDLKFAQPGWMDEYLENWDLIMGLKK